MKERIRRIVNLIRHKVAFMKTEKRLRGKMTLISVTHDLDKLLWFLTPMPTEWVRMRHKQKARHHNENEDSPNKIFEEKVIDWECARLTKRKSQLNALEWFNYSVGEVGDYPKFERAFKLFGLLENDKGLK